MGLFMLSLCTMDFSFGRLVGVASEQEMFLLAFEQGQSTAKRIARVCAHWQTQKISVRENAVLRLCKQQVTAYASGQLQSFSVPFCFVGTDFQQRVWRALCTIPYGQTICYGMVARGMGHPLGVRAVANAIAANILTVIVPCHRVIRSTNELGGYSGGKDAKQCLLALEKDACEKRKNS